METHAVLVLAIFCGFVAVVIGFFLINKNAGQSKREGRFLRLLYKAGVVPPGGGFANETPATAAFILSTAQETSENISKKTSRGQTMEKTRNRLAQDEIKSDHEAIRRLIDRWEAEEDGSPKSNEIIDETLDELEIHSRIEEEILYPECRRVWVTSISIINDAFDDHIKMDDQIAEIREEKGMRKEDDFRVLVGDVLTHLDEEESVILPDLENIISTEESERIGDRLKMRKAELRTASIGRAA